MGVVLCKDTVGNSFRKVYNQSVFRNPDFPIGLTCVATSSYRVPSSAPGDIREKQGMIPALRKER